MQRRTRSRNQARIADIARAIEELSNELNVDKRPGGTQMSMQAPPWSSSFLTRTAHSQQLSVDII